MSKDPNRAYQIALAGVRAGCHHCKGALACCLLHGWGSERDVDHALALAKESSTQGSKYGYYMLGYALSDFCGIDDALYVKHGIKEQDKAEQAGMLFSAASDSGLVEAHYELAHAFQSKDAFQNPEQVFRLCSQAADFGHPAAHESVGYFLLRGTGTRVDKVAAARHLEAAAESGCIGALRLLSECESVPKNVYASRDSSGNQVRTGIAL
jgi:TPR repeat protein